ncbi:MAG: NYN domain-containing protein [Verrucomicrobiota bacterium]
METSGQYLLVDGHSVIFHWPELRRVHEKDRRKARSLLIRSLKELHDTTDWLVTLVFDGKQGQCEKPQAGQMVILYAKAHQTADGLIERLTAQVEEAKRSLVWVVTADGVERKTVESLGAVSVDPDWLKRELELQGQNWKQSLGEVHRRAKW